MRLSDFMKKFSRENLLADLCAAIAAGLAAALVTFGFTLLYYKPIPIVTPFRYLLLGVASYSVVALFLNRFWKGLPRRIVPSWLLIGMVGSIVFILARLTPGVIGGWYDPFRVESSFKEYLSNEVSAVASVVLSLCAVTIPTAGLAYYGVWLVRALKQRRLDPEVRTPF